MTVNCPTEVEIRDLFLDEFDRLAETRTEDRHPAPEFWAWLAHEGYPIYGMDSLAFADEAFDLWERANATRDTVHRWISDREARPAHIDEAVKDVIERALNDLDYLIRRHVGQPPVRLAG